MNSKKLKKEIMRITKVKKTLGFTLSLIVLCTLSINAQQTPEPPTPPSTKSGTSYSIFIDNDDNKVTNSSVSISESDDAYKFRATYHKSKNSSIKELLIEKLGKKDLKVNGNTYLWTNSTNGDEFFECKLTNGRLRMSLDLDYASDGLFKKVKRLGKDLKHYISGSNKEG